LADAGEEVDCPPPVLLKIAILVDRVVDAALLAFVLRQDGIEAAIVAITRGQEALWRPSGTPSTKQGDKGGEVAIRFAQGTLW